MSRGKDGGRNRLGSWSLAAAALGFLLVNLPSGGPLAAVPGLPGTTLRDLLAAFFDAALVGALADWFAVTALFRRPLGVPLPHTDVIARNKENVARAVPRFLAGFVPGGAIRRELEAVDFAGLLESGLREGPGRDRFHEIVRGRLSALLVSGRAGPGLRTVLAGVRDLAAREVDLPAAGAKLAAWAAESQYTGQLMAGLARILQTEIARNRAELVDYLTAKLKQGAGWQGIFIGTGTTEKMLAAIVVELEGIQRDPRHELRVFAAKALASWARRLEHDPVERTRFTALVLAALDNAAFADQAAAFAEDLVRRMGADLERPDGRFTGTLERLEDLFLTKAAGDPEFRTAFNGGIARLAADVVEQGELVPTLAGYLEAQMARTETKAFVAQVEGAVWNDLQYIRLNGAVVGGLVGLILFSARTLLGG